MTNLHQQALSVLKTHFGYQKFRGHQADIIQCVASGQNALVLMPTGGGKSLCYQIPSLIREGIGIVISPLIALMQDQVNALELLGIPAAFLNSTQNYAEVRRIEQQAIQGHLKLLYIAPERLMTDHCQQLLSQCRIALFAIDEAHCVSQWGHDFRPEYIQLSILHEKFPRIPRIALTATADPQTRQEIAERLQLTTAQHFVSSFDRPNITYHIVEKGQARQQLLRFITEYHATDSGIVYCLSRKKVEETAAFLSDEGLNAYPYHAGMSTNDRSTNQARFLREEQIIMVATIAFGMGIDKPDVRFVAHLDLPKSMEGYYQETGRAGRDGQKATAWMAYGLQDVVQQRKMIEESEASDHYKRIQSTKLEAMLGLCETLNCRRVQLLHYFGETSTACGNCDNCLYPPESFDGTILAQKLLSAIYRVNQRFGAGHVIDVLRGIQSEKVKQWHHDALSTFGIGKDIPEVQWRTILRQLLARGYITIDHNAYGSLKLTEQARPVLKGEEIILLRKISKPPLKTKKNKRTAKNVFERTTLSNTETILFDALREWRRDAARSKNVPAYVIFHDATLREIAQVCPQNLSELRSITGMGIQKIQNYGEDLIKLISEVSSE